MRFAIWSAVSSKSQAASEKVSLSEQENKCRAAAQAKGWKEAAGPFIVPGESRTRWINLRDAESNIPALKDMLDQAQRGLFDVLLLYDYTRLRELLDPVAKTLSAYGVQLYSISQPVEPVPPDQYDSSTAESAATQQFVSGFTSRTEIAALRRRYKLGMPRRVSDKGLPPTRPPYGYRKPPGREFDPSAVPIADSLQSAVIIQIKDLFLAGQSMNQIADHINTLNIPTPSKKNQWTSVHVRYIITNRFYCGEIHYGRVRRSIDPRTGRLRYIKNPPTRRIVGVGKHIPLWDLSTQHRIDAELKRRGKKYTGKRTQRLSNILYCGVCGARVCVAYNGTYSDTGRRWVCINSRSHVNRLDNELLPRIAEQLKHDLQHFNDIQLPEPDDDHIDYTPQLLDLTARRSRLIDAYEAGTLPFDEYTRRISTIETALLDLEGKQSDSGEALTRHAEQLALIGGLRGVIESTPDYLLHAPAQEVNTHLCQLLEKITVTPDTVKLSFLK